MKLHPRLTAEGVLLVRRAERFRPDAERDADRQGGWVVGYGHRASTRAGARVTEADATALLAYDLSRSAGRVEALLGRQVSPALFDALNAFAFRVGPESFARSDLLRRVNAGEPVTPAEAAAAPGSAEEAPSSAFVAAADAVRDRLAQVLTEPEPPPPPRPRRSPWPEPPAPAPRLPDPEPAHAVEDEAPDHPDHPDPSEARRPDREADAPRLKPDGPAPARLERERPETPPPLIAAPAGSDMAGAAPAGPAAAGDLPQPDAGFPPSFAASPAGEPDAAGAAPAPPAPMVNFERGGRPKLWDRLRGSPYLYMAVGACGLGLFACAILGFLLGRPSGPGLALGVVGVACVAPALAFFLHRGGRRPRGRPSR